MTPEERGDAYRALVGRIGRSVRISSTQGSAHAGAAAESIQVEDNDEVVVVPDGTTAAKVGRALGMTAEQARDVFGSKSMSALQAINDLRRGIGQSSPVITRHAEEPGDSPARFGRVLPKDRYSLDQVPCMLVEGDMRTYHMIGAHEHVWVAGSGKGDEGKRFCSLQLLVRCVNGDKSKLYCEQPWPEICFRGAGVRITDVEKASWNKNVHVAFQPKAWYDEENCLRYITERMPGVTSDARRGGRESFLFTDNLHGQTTDEYRAELWSRSKTKLHLLPAGLTDLLQLIDAGLGFLVKYYLGEFHSAWLLEGDNLERWTDGLAMWERRVHITNMLGLAYARACLEYDFEKNAGKLGMLLTVNGAGDELISLQGLGPVTFTDADGGSIGNPSEDEEDSDDDSDAGSADGENDDDSLVADDTDDDEEDDTAAVDAAAAEAIPAPTPPTGYLVDEEALTAENDVIGRKILFKWDGAPLRSSDFGWYPGTVKSMLSATEKAKNPGCSFNVTLKNSETNGVLPGCWGSSFKGPKAHGVARLGVTEATRGTTKQWVLLKKED